ncbi:hypothetical protein NIES4073_05340 [Kalymmatonema gypsitolerans NIES-4073]|jgi:hypothetical protein|nr:hypothetical protein NIES4073_05340 [Scytonema sp. NIES-4073]
MWVHLLLICGIIFSTFDYGLRLCSRILLECPSKNQLQVLGSTAKLKNPSGTIGTPLIIEKMDKR